MGDVPERHRCLVVGDVLELVLVRDVTDRPHAVDGGAHVLVDHDGAVVVARQAARLDIEQIAVRLAAGRDEQFVDLDDLTRAVDRDRVAHAVRSSTGRCCEVDVDASREHLGEALRDLVGPGLAAALPSD